MLRTQLDRYDNSWYHPGKSGLVQVLWYCVNALIFQNPLFPINSVKVRLLRLFGARVGQGVVIKPSVSIKYPWRLSIGNHVWIGERVWIDNLADVQIGHNVCISQDALLLTGSHNYKQPTFDLMIGSIVVEEGSWIGAKTVVCPGVTCRTHSVLTVGSIAVTDLAAYKIYQGNPATEKRSRISSSVLQSTPPLKLQAVFT